IKAAERMGKLHDRLRASGYSGHDLEVFLVRLLFCLFAEDTTLFEPRGSFREFIENNTREDGSDLGSQLTMLFQVLDTAESSRQMGLNETFAAFPYVNGRLFEEKLSISVCNSTMRTLLLDCCALDWGRISPAIFGALFQCVMDEEGSARRRNLGAHYTSEENILKLIRPLFLDDLWAEFRAAKGNHNRLQELHKKLSSLRFFDPACGCGNFLVIAYRELRLLELEILLAARKSSQLQLDSLWREVQINVDQFYGIEIEEFPAQIAQVALWLTDHQMNMIVSEEFGQYFRRLPLTHTATVYCGNALKMDWNTVIPVNQVNFILGNPPFGGKQYQNDQQKADMSLVFAGVNGAGVLDYVTAWYLKAVQYIRSDRTDVALNKVKIAFVSTNSITQGEQVGVLWAELLRQGVKIHFSHRTFQWSNEARGMAAVHCVIIGFALHDTSIKTIYDYPDLKGEPHAYAANNINPYLVDAPDVLLPKRDEPLSNVSHMRYGSKPVDGGYLLLTNEAKAELLEAEPNAKKYIRRFLGADEFLYNIDRWCLWLKDISPAELKAMPAILKRVDAVRSMRLASKKAPTRQMAAYPTLFAEDRQPNRDYIIVPEVSSERRQYLPVGFVSKAIISSNLNYTIPDATLFVFGMISSNMHMAWVRAVAGRLESRYRYSSQLIYNTFPWPSDPTEKQRLTIEQAAQAVLDARGAHPEASLADLYDPVAMPPDLRKAHQILDKVVDAAYGRRNFTSDAERVAYLFELYHKYTSLLPVPEVQKRRRRKL
ncbi:MAG TPA: DNA methyltransferase, partial [Nitrospirota bacterium]|nr:DNA methyltransferase [Nitrospirota bacterium]